MFEGSSLKYSININNLLNCLHERGEKYCYLHVINRGIQKDIKIPDHYSKIKKQDLCWIR